MNIFNSLLPQLVKYDVHATRKINSIHAIFYHILSFYYIGSTSIFTPSGFVLVGRKIRIMKMMMIIVIIKKLPSSQSKADHPRMRAFSYACLLPVT